MRIWLDAQLSPSLASWLNETFDIEATALRDLGLRDSEDDAIFEAARQSEAVVLSKDRDFAELVDRLGPPPQVVWVTCGNTSNVRIREDPYCCTAAGAGATAWRLTPGRDQ